MNERKRGMMGGEMRGYSDEQAIKMIDRCTEPGVRDGENRDKMRDGRDRGPERADKMRIRR